MPIAERTHAEIINHLHTERRRLEKNLARLTPAEIEQPSVVG